jgi:hypothetical protein
MGAMRAPGLLLILMVAACGDDTGPPDARRPDAPPPGGTVSLTWTITDEGAPLTCAQVGSTLVSLTMVPQDQVFGVTDAFSCASGGATSRTLAEGVYDISVSLGGVDIDALRFDDVTVTAGQDTALGVAAFEVNAEGGFQFTISAGGQGNCTAIAEGGAGIDSMRIDLETFDGQCVPVTFDIAAGASQPASTYTTDCTAPAPHVCIAQDQQVSVAPTVATGTYRMSITGTVQGADCWSRVAQFDVPAAGATENLPQQNLVLDSANPACVP